MPAALVTWLTGTALLGAMGAILFLDDIAARNGRRSKYNDRHGQ
jgi:hypothetical protein